MKKACNSVLRVISSTKSSLLLLLACFFVLINIGCGLDVYYYLEEPEYLSEALYTNEEDIRNYFSFRTYEESPNVSSSEFMFMGTEVYYKIYNNPSEMISVNSKVESVQSSTTSATSGINMLQDLKYQTLKLSSGVDLTPLIKKTGTSRNVYIRLTDYDFGDYRAGICVSSTTAMDHFIKDYSIGNDASGNPVKPRRCVLDSSTSEPLSFNFGGSSKIDKAPLKTDDDVKYSESGYVEGVWYVDLYAVSKGNDSVNFSDSYSQVLWLGAVKITEGQYSSN